MPIKRIFIELTKESFEITCLDTKNYIVAAQ